MKPTPTLTEALELCQKALSMMITPAQIDQTSTLQAFAIATEAEAKARAALSVPAAAVVGEQLRTMLEQAYKEGFEASGEGFNAEYHHDFAADNEWLADRDIAVSGLIDAVPSAPDGWQPIETAPKDKTPVIVAVLDKDCDGFSVGEAYFDPEHYEDGDWWWAGTRADDWGSGPISDVNYHNPSLWRPLPAPPALGGASHE